MTDTGGGISSALGAAGAATGNPFLAIGGQLLGGLFGSSSAKKANKEAKKMMREQMAWQERMANTVHQRGVIDLRAAGLNPILSATKGFSAAMPGNVSAAPVLNEGAAGQASALAIQNAAAQTDLLKAQAENVRAQTETEKNKPENVAQSTKTGAAQAQSFESAAALSRQLEITEGWKSKQAIAELALKNVTTDIAEKYGMKMAEEAMRQARSQSQIMAGSAKSAEATEKALEMLPAEYVAIIRVLKAALSGR